MDKSTAKDGDFNSPVSIIGRTSRWKISKNIEKVKSTINQLNLTGIHRILHIIIAEYTFLSSVHETFIERLYPGS